MDGYQLLFRFILGGSVVVLATVLADVSRNPYVAGLAMCFPGLLLAGALALVVSGHPPNFLSGYFIGSLGGIVIVSVFAIAASVLIRNFGFWAGVGMAILVWFVLASVAILAMLRFRE